MVFSDRGFIFLFLPLALFAILALTKVRLRYISILLLSLLFYYYSAGIIIWTLGFCIIASFILGIVIERNKSPFLLSTSIIALLLPLIFFKYSLFIALNLGVSVESNLGSFMDVALPAGISFFTFQSISYIIDIYRDELKADKNFFRYAAYLSFFPQLIAGPIVRYVDVDEDFKANNHSFSRFNEGITRFVHGLMKKLLIADNAGRISDSCFALGNDELTFAVALLGAIAYTIQIYYDFSGYSDMAIGLAKMFGVKLPENFNSPYESRSITEFWRRWHITLSSWFRDYLYISLGGNRVPTNRLYLNLMLVFVATGVWHGAAWTFVIWGIYHGFFILFEKKVWGTDARRLPFERYRFVYLLPAVIVGWIIFRATSISQAWAFISVLSNPFQEGAFSMSNSVWAAATPNALLALLVGCICFFKRSKQPIGVVLEDLLQHNTLRFLTFSYIVFSLVVILIIVLSSSFSPFLYFQF